MGLKQNLSENLKALRASRGLSLADFAEVIGIAKSTLQDIESGKSSTLDTVDHIARNLKIPASTLLSDAASPEQLSITIQIVQRLDWFSSLSPDERKEIIRLIERMAEIMARST